MSMTATPSGSRREASLSGFRDGVPGRGAAPGDTRRRSGRQRTGRQRRGPLDHPGIALACLAWSLAVAIGLWIGGQTVPPLQALEGLAYDLRTAVLPLPANRTADDVLLVRIDEDSLRGQPWRDPVDRRLVAEVIASAGQLGARAVGVAMTFAEPRMAEADDALIAALRDAPLPVAIGIDPDGGSLQSRLLALAVGGVTVPETSLPDATARALPQVDTGTRPPHMLTELARMIRAAPPTQPVLRTFADPAPPTVSAADLAGLDRSRIEGRVVIIDPAREDGLDPRYRTALAVRGSDGMTSGELIARGLTQLTGGVRPVLPADWQTTLLLLGSALIGLVIGGAAWSPQWRLATGTALSGAYAGGTSLLYLHAALALPAALPLLAFWLAGLGAYVIVDRRRIGLRGRLRAAHGDGLDGAALRAALSLGGQAEAALAAGQAVSRRVTSATIVTVDAALAAEAADWLEPAGFADALSRHRAFVRKALVDAGGLILQFDGTRATALFGGFGQQPDHAVRALRSLVALRDTGSPTGGRPMPSASLGPIRAVADSGAVTLSLCDDRCGAGLSVEGAPVASATRLLEIGERLGSPLCATAQTVSDAFASGEEEVALRPIAELQFGASETLVSLFEAIPRDMAATQETRAYYAAFRRMRDLDPEAPYLFRALHERSPEDPLIGAHLRRLTSGGSGSVVVFD